MRDKRYFIGEVSKESNVPQKTIRYYEGMGLLEPPPRTEGNYRLYNEEAVERLRFIKRAQRLGLSLSEIKSIMRCSKEGLRPCCDLVRNLFTGKIKEFEAKIKELQRMRNELNTLLAQWIPLKEARKGRYTVCPQIEREPRLLKRKKGGDKQ